MDQSRVCTNFISVHGIINFIDSNLNDDELVLVENSHTIFKNYMTSEAARWEKYPSDEIMYTCTDLNDSLFDKKKLIKICAPAGSIILFDSQTFHCNVPPRNNESKYRMCTYVSVQPR